MFSSPLCVTGTPPLLGREGTYLGGLDATINTCLCGTVTSLAMCEFPLVRVTSRSLGLLHKMQILTISYIPASLI